MRANGGGDFPAARVLRIYTVISKNHKVRNHHPTCDQLKTDRRCTNNTWKNDKIYPVIYAY
jgi:hypothetical protein